MRTKLYEMVFSDDILIDGVSLSGVTTVSLVNNPAVDSAFMLFSKNESIDTVDLKFSYDDERRIITGVALRANYPIERNDEIRGKHYVIFSPETIEKIVIKFFENHIDRVSLNHNLDVENVNLIESFFLNDYNRIAYPNLSDVANGSWCLSHKIENMQVWDLAKRENIKGYSVEIHTAVKSVETLNDYSGQLNSTELELLYNKINN